MFQILSKSQYKEIKKLVQDPQAKPWELAREFLRLRYDLYIGTSPHAPIPYSQLTSRMADQRVVNLANMGGVQKECIELLLKNPSCPPEILYFFGRYCFLQITRRPQETNAHIEHTSYNIWDSQAYPKEWPLYKLWLKYKYADHSFILPNTLNPHAVWILKALKHNPVLRLLALETDRIHTFGTLGLAIHGERELDFRDTIKKGMARALSKAEALMIHGRQDQEVV